MQCTVLPIEDDWFHRLETTGALQGTSLRSHRVVRANVEFNFISTGCPSGLPHFYSGLFPKQMVIAYLKKMG